MNTKFCNKCELDVPIAGFYRERPDKLMACCKECHKARVRHRRAERIDQCRAYDRMRHHRDRERRLEAIRVYAATPAGKAALAAARRRYIERNPEKRAAHVALGNALRRGKVIRPAQCEGCGQAGRVHAHHDDYSRPLDVRWLCVPCHERVHHMKGPVRRALELGEA